MTGTARDLIAGARALEACLEAQERVYTDMLSLCAREEAAIVAGDVATLTALIEEKEQLIEHLHALETERMTALVAIGGATGTDPECLTLSEIAEALPAEARAAVIETGVMLRARALALKQANEHNAHLLRSSRSVVDRWIHYLRTLVSGALYNGSGSAAPGQGGPRSVDRSA